MSSAPAMTLSGIAAQAYSVGYAHHGDLDLRPERFEAQLYLIIEKLLGPDALTSAQLSCADSLRTTDLYLTIACAQPTDLGWRRFTVAYQRYIDRIARYVSSTNSEAQELSENLLADLFLHDSTGRSRIATFDGRQSLATWLRVVISRRAINHSLVNRHNVERFDRDTDVADKSCVDRMESEIRRNRYGAILSEALEEASESLTDRERLVLLLRYEEGLRLVQIAKAIGIHPSGITRKFRQLHLKLQKKIVSILAVKYQLGPETIKECLLDIVENPAYSVLVFLKAS